MPNAQENNIVKKGYSIVKRREKSRGEEESGRERKRASKTFLFVLLCLGYICHVPLALTTHNFKYKIKNCKAMMATGSFIPKDGSDPVHFVDEKSESGGVTHASIATSNLDTYFVS